MNASLPDGELFTAISMRTKPKIVAKKPSATSMKTALTGDAYNRYASAPAALSRMLGTISHSRLHRGRPR